MRYRAVLFDLDGTLLDTLEDLAASGNRMLKHFGFPTHAPEKYKYFVGDGMENLVRRTLPEEHRDEESVEVYVSKFLEEYDGRWDEKTCPYPGIHQMLDELESSGIRMAILSNKPHEFTRTTAAKLLSDWQFEIVMGAGDAFPRKPDPSAALEIAQRMQIPPGDFLYLGDTNTDMITANAAGMYAVGVLWGFRGEKELIESGAKAIAKQPADVIELIAGKCA